MLILSRRISETIIIDDHIVLQLLDVKGSQVRLGITAPKVVVILREELAERGLEPS
jgi:carbon storage regulator